MPFFNDRGVRGYSKRGNIINLPPITNIDVGGRNEELGLSTLSLRAYYEKKSQYGLQFELAVDKNKSTR